MTFIFDNCMMFKTLDFFFLQFPGNFRFQRPDISGNLNSSLLVHIRKYSLFMANLGNVQLEILKGRNKNKHFKIISMKISFF